jgi:NhaP-type Na+/H+ or K+/H+ antiporter/rhodanese-related sulfurtransferase
MEGFNTESFTAALALIGAVILISALLSGIIEKSGLPQVAFFLALGAALGPAGLGVLNIQLDSAMLRIVATLSLVMVLFTDAVTLNLNEVRKNGKLALLVCGPGTLLSAVLIAVASWAMLGLSPAAAAIVGAALASTDPVLLKNLIRLPGVPNSTRQALRLESGMNDIVLLPIVLVALVFLEPGTAPNTDGLVKLGLDLLVLGPGAGIGVGLLAVATMDLIRRRFGIRRDYESLYSLGVAFTAYAAAEAVHGSGFLAAFAAGLTISALDIELCDCFLEYGETTAEMALLLTFVLFGGSLIWSGFGILTLTTFAFAVVALLVRPAAFLVALAPIKLIPRSRWLIAWYGPRGLSTLLLVLLAVFAQAPGSVYLFQICCLVVLLSILLHGFSPALVSRTRARVKNQPLAPITAAPEGTQAKTVSFGPASTLPAGTQTPDGGPPPLPDSAQVAPATGPVSLPEKNRTPVHTEKQKVDFIFPAKPEHDKPLAQAPTHAQDVSLEIPAHPTTKPKPAHTSQEEAEDNSGPVDIRNKREFITLDEFKELLQKGEPVVILDVRTERTFEIDQKQAKEAVRINPAFAVKQATEKNLPRNAWIIAYCA